jgi:hypothetical protein
MSDTVRHVRLRATPADVVRINQVLSLLSVVAEPAAPATLAATKELLLTFSKSVRQRAAEDWHNPSVFGPNAAGVQCLTACLQYHQLRKHLVVLVLFLDWIRTLQL